MALLTSIPGTSATNDGFLPIASIKQTAKVKSSALHGASAINLIATARKVADSGILKEDEGDLQEALLKYYTTLNVLNTVLDKPEYKAEAPANKHGVVYREALAFSEYIRDTIVPRIKPLESRMQLIESARMASPTGTPVLNGHTSSDEPPNPRDGDDGVPNQRPGGSLADRMKALQGAGLDMTIAGVTNKRFSHRSSASTSTVTSSPLQPSSSSKFRNTIVDHPSSPAQASFPDVAPVHPPPSPITAITPSTTVASSSRRHTINTTSQSQTVTYSPSLSPLPPPTPTASWTADPPSPIVESSSGSSRTGPSELRRQATGDLGISHSPRHRNLQNLATPSSPAWSGGTASPPRFNSAPFDHSPTPPAPFEPPTPSISTFNNAFPTIDDLDTTYGVTGLHDESEVQLPIFPSVPLTAVGSKVPGLGPPPSSNALDLWKTVPVSPALPFSRFAGAEAASRSDSQVSAFSPILHSHSEQSDDSVYRRGSSAAETKVSTHGTGESSSSRSQSSGQSQPRASSTVRYGPRPIPSIPSSSVPPSSYAPPSQSHGKKPDIPITNSIFPKTLNQYLDDTTNGGLEVLLLDVRSRQEFEMERIDCKWSVCIEPTILSRANIEGSGIESALVISPNAEEKAFNNRQSFDLVVMYDGSSSKFTPALAVLNNAIYETEFRGKRLQRPPMLLIGGLEAWRKDLGRVGLVGNGVERGNEETERAAGKVSATAVATQPANTPNGITNGQPVTYKSSAVNGRVRREMLPTGAGVAGATPMNGDDFAEKERHRRTHIRDGAVYEAPDVNDENASPTASRPTERLIRKSTLTRPSSSGNISAYNRPIPDVDRDVYAGFPTGVMSPTIVNTPPTSFASSSQSIISPTQPSAVALPPQASISVSPLARRRSDYVEQALYSYSGSTTGSNRAPIDYPALSSLNMLKYPPAVATNALERHEPRYRNPLSPGGQQDPSNHQVTMVNGKPFIMPPTINAARYHVIYWDEVQIGMSGLKNLGNTCYMNSIVQCLSATVPFARFFIDGRWKSSINMQNPLGTQGNVAHAFANIVYELWQGESPYLTPYGFRKQICAYAPQFSGSDQHDAQEFLSFLMDGLHEDLNRIIKKPALPSPTPEREQELERLPTQIASAQEWQLYRMRDDSLVVDYFQGQFRNVLRCLTCHKTSTTYNSFMYLSLPIPTHRGLGKTNLYQCVDAFVKPEIMEKSDAWNCPHCKTLRKATKQLSLSRMPPVLLIHLKRFSTKGPFTDKLETMVDFPLKGLDLTNYLPALLPPNISKVEGYGQEPINPTTDPRAQIPPYKYDLYGVTNHMGRLSTGHYTSFISSKGGWVNCDDSRLSNANPKDVVNRDAYILYYKRVRTY